MKRFFKIFSVLLVLLIAAIIALPIIFKSEIVERTKQEINKSIEADVDFSDIDLGLISTFPHFSMDIHNLSVDGRDHFEGLRLAEVGLFHLKLDIFSILFGDEIAIRKIALNDARLHVRIDEEGRANYDLMKADEPEDPPAQDFPAEEAGFKLSLRGYSIENLDLIYEDREADIEMSLLGIQHRGNGDFTQDLVNLSTSTEIARVTVGMDGMNYLDKVQAQADVDLEFDQPAFKISFGDNRLVLNELPIEFSGFVALPEEDIEMDLQFAAADDQFKNLISLIPALYYQDFASLEARGSFALKGNVSGVYNGEREVYPSFGLEASMKNGYFHYPELPSSVDKVFMELSIQNPEDHLDATVIDLKEARAQIAGSPVEASFFLSHPMSDPRFRAALKADMDLANLAQVVPSSDYRYSGQFKADARFTGRMSQIDAENYEAITAEGDLEVTEILLQSDSLDWDVSIPRAHLFLSPQKAVLDALDMTIGQSDFQMNGELYNIAAYALRDELLQGRFALSSNYMDLNELSGGEAAPAAEGEGESAEGAGSMEVIRLPQNLDIGMEASLKELRYDDMQIMDLQGSLKLTDGIADLNSLTMKMLGGTLAMDGRYNSVSEIPEVDFNFKINDFSFSESAEKLSMVQKLAPIMGHTRGNYSTGLTFAARLQHDMSPELASVTASGRLRTSALETSGKTLSKLAAALRNDKLATLNLRPIDLSFAIADGRLAVEPFDLNAGPVKATVSGTSGLDQSLDYDMDMQIPITGIKGGNLLEQIGASRQGMASVKVKIGGTMSDPKVSTSLKDFAEGIKDKLKQEAKEKVEQVTQQAKDKVNEKAEELVRQAEKKGDELIAAAEKQASNIRQEAARRAQQLRDEAEKQASKVEREAKGNRLKEIAAAKTAKRIRSEADDKAQKLEDEADKRANDLVNKAKAEKEKLINEAREKGRVD